MTRPRPRRPRALGRPRPVPARRPTGSPPRRHRPHRAVQLGVRPPPRRHARASASRTPTRPATPTRPTTRSSTRCAGSASTGTRARRSAATTGRTGSPSGSPIYADVAPALREAGRPTTATAPTTRSRRAARPAAPRTRGTTASAASSTAEQLAAFQAEGRDAGAALPDARRRDHLRRPGARRDHLPCRSTCPTSRSCAPTATRSTRWSTRVDDALMGITHVLRGEDLLSSTPRQIALYDALQRLGVGERHAALRAPADGDGRGQQASCPSATRGSGLLELRRPRLPARGPAELPRPARLGHRRGPRRLHDGGDGRGVRHRAASTPTRRAST